ncbi:MAG: ferrous iron transporter B, partial [Ignavibacteriales bacterium]|nr:ferrous iron transporter B [Ignavibacteriales bacterium]
GMMNPGDLRDLLVHGIIEGTGSVVVFIPQIAFLFLFLGILEESGYLSRAAFIMDRVMRKSGLHGKAFIPLLSSFGCTVPSIMATRTLGHERDRIATMMVAPLLSCSARLPVYALLIAALIPQRNVLGFLSLPGLTLAAIYLFGVLAAFIVAWILKKILSKNVSTPFIMELPPYRLPSLKNVALQVWERTSAFLQKAGTVILGASIVLWFLLTYPKSDAVSAGERLEQSFAGKAGHMIEPVIRPLGFNWKIGIGLISSLLQREVFVSTMCTMYGIDDHNSGSSV